MIDKKIKTVIDTIKQINGESSDISSKELEINGKKIAYIYLESTSGDDKISNFLGKSLSFDVKNKKSNLFENLFKYLENTIPNSKLITVENYDDMFYYLASGFTCILVEGNNKCIAVETKADLNRSISESTSQPVVKGPKDSFTENYQSNIGLIRKRIKDPKLWFKEIKVGRRTKTKISVAYIEDVANDKNVRRILKELEKIDIDGIIDSSYLKELIDTKSKSSFPRVVSTERPDSTCMSLLEGKIAIIVENSPFALLLPGLFVDFFVSPEDYYRNPSNSSITRVLRYIAFFIAILTPAIYVAIVTYNVEVVPNSLLISFSMEREGIPFPTIIEVLILIISYQILLEADTHKPQIMGASISIVGALILGEAAVSAGIISPIVIIIVSIAAIAGMAFTDPDISNAISTWRIIFMIASSLMGLIGVFLVGTFFIIKLCSLDSLDTPYLTPIAPIRLKEWKRSIFRGSQRDLKERPDYLTDKNKTRLGDEI